MRRLIRFLTAIICLPLIYFGAALGGAAIPGERADLPAGTEYLIGLVHGPLHFDLMLPLSPELRARYGFATAAGVPVANPQAEWLLVGWGAAAFYTSTARLADMTLSPVVRGLAKARLGFSNQGAGMVEFFADTVGADGIAQVAASVRGDNQAKEQAIGAFSKAGERWIEGATTSIATQLPSLLAGVVTGAQAPVLALMAWLKMRGKHP